MNNIKKYPSQIVSSASTNGSVILPELDKSEVGFIVMKEVWKDIPQWDGLYQVSNKGKIKSLRKNIILKPGNNGRGYLFVYLQRDGLSERHYIHRLVGILFVPNPLRKPCINHIDCDKGSNHYSNLEWVTHKENMSHGALNSRFHVSDYQKAQITKANSGVKSHLSKLDDNSVIKIRELYESGLTQKQISLIYGVHRATIGYIVTGRTWKHI